MQIDFAASGLPDIFAIEKSGAAGAILISSLSEYGTTPSIGLIVQAVNAVNININVIVAPPSPICGEYDLAVMQDDICAIAQTKANAVVVGLLKEDGNVNIRQLEQILPKLGDKGLIFSSTIDSVNNIAESARILSKYDEIKGIYTHGGKGSFNERMETVRKMREAAPELFISVGGVGSLSLSHIHEFCGATAFHAGLEIRQNHLPQEVVDLFMAQEFVSFAEKLEKNGADSV